MDEAVNEAVNEAAAEAANMVCPNCHTFQPRAEACNECGVIIEKALNAGKTPVEKQKPVVVDDTPKTNKLWLVLLLTCVFFYYSKHKDKENEELEAAAPAAVTSPKTPSKTPEQEQSAAAAAVNPDIESNTQRDKVMIKLQAIKSTLYRLHVEGKMPPSNEEGLQYLVDEGILTQADITDEWGNTFVYRLEWTRQAGQEKQYSIFVRSRGPDGISGNDDDIIMP